MKQWYLVVKIGAQIYISYIGSQMFKVDIQHQHLDVEMIGKMNLGVQNVLVGH